jgi:hypothetical protein
MNALSSAGLGRVMTRSVHYDSAGAKLELQMSDGRRTHYSFYDPGAKAEEGATSSAHADKSPTFPLLFIVSAIINLLDARERAEK